MGSAYPAREFASRDPRRRRQVAIVLPSRRRKHSWPDTIAAGHFGTTDKVTLTKVKPKVVIEVAVDAAMVLRSRL